MNTEIKLHPIQAQVLKTLLFKLQARFAELNLTGLTTDLFSFHLRQLRNDKLIQKNGDGGYELTRVGKEFANRLDTESLNIEKQAKVAVLVMPQKTIKGKIYYLVQKRLKQPFFGYSGFLTGKVRWSETIGEAALRELREETGLTGRVRLRGVKHKMDYSAGNEMLEDKFFFVFKADKLEGKLIEKFEGGENRWLTRDEFFNLPDLFDGVEDNFVLVEKKGLKYLEKKYIIKRY
ncbi:MAG: NUDIX hydrolase [Candidatus Shapirobacteria bacterium]|jgi:ADP-ribose pyrophosphatase YjhB (NUDIX family)